MRFQLRPTLLLALATLTATLPGCTGPGLRTDDAQAVRDGLPVPFELTGESLSGFVLLHLANPAGLNGGIDLGAHMDFDDLVAVQMTLVAPNGTVRQVLHGAEFDNSHYAKGDGVVHAGIGEEGAAAPKLQGDAQQDAVVSRVIDLPDWTTAHLVILWTGQLETPQLRSVWSPGTQVDEVARGDVVQVELKDLRGGAHVGTPVLGVSVADAITVVSGQVWGDVRVFRSNVAMGELGIVADGERRVLDLAYGCSVTQCGSSFDVRRIHFSSEGGASLDVFMAGNTRSTKVLATFALLPETILPPLYLEAEEAFP